MFLTLRDNVYLCCGLPTYQSPSIEACPEMEHGLYHVGLIVLRKWQQYSECILLLMPTSRCADAKWVWLGPMFPLMQAITFDPPPPAIPPNTFRTALKTVLQKKRVQGTSWKDYWGEMFATACICSSILIQVLLAEYL